MQPTGWKIFLVFSVALLVVAALFEILSPDLYWHLKMGHDLVFSRLSPFVDHYSFTFSGAPINSVAWPFQIVITLFYEFLGGLRGVQLFRFLTWISGFYFLLKIFKTKQITKPVQAVGILFFLFAVLYHTEPRPDLLTLTLELGLYILLPYWWRRPSWQRSLGVVSLFVIWSNYHVSSVFAFIILAAFVTEKIFEYLSQKNFTQARKLFAYGVLFASTGFLCHRFAHPLFAQAQLAERWNIYITEYRHRTFGELEITLQLYWLLLAATLPALIVRRNIAGIIIYSVVGYKSWEMSKLFPHLIFMTLPFAIEILDLYRKAIQHRFSQFGKWLWTVAFIFLSTALLWQQLDSAIFHPIHPLGTVDKSYFPVTMIERLKQNKTTGRVLNDYGQGGFVLFSLYPEIQVYIDGRTSILYPIEFMDHMAEVATQPLTFSNEVKKYNITHVLAKSDAVGELLTTALDSGLFSIVDAENKMVLLARNTEHFALTTSAFIHPECLKEDVAALKRELHFARATLTSDSIIRPFLELAVQYSATERSQRASLFVTPNPAWIGNDFVSRLAAQLAEAQGASPAAYYYLNFIGLPTQDDRIQKAHLDCKLNHCASAERYLSEVTTVGLREDHIYEAVKLLELIKSEVGLKIFDEARIERNRLKVKKYLQMGQAPAKPNPCRF